MEKNTMKKSFIEKINKKSFIEKELNKNIKKSEIKKQKLKNLKISLFIGLITLFSIEVYITNLINSFLIALILFCFIFLILSIKPIIENKRKIKKIEAELPFFLMKLVTEIKIGNSFFTALKKNCKGNQLIEKEFGKIIKNMESGKSFEESVKEINISLPSIEIKRALSSITNIYSHGGSEESLKRLTEELFLKQRIASKEFSGKMVVYSLVFIAISAIVPAMFSSFILIGSYFMSFEFSGFQVFLIITLVFPILNILILLIINSKTPVFLKG